MILMVKYHIPLRRFSIYYIMTSKIIERANNCIELTHLCKNNNVSMKFREISENKQGIAV